MNEAFLIKSIFLFISLWGIGLIFVWCRPKIDIFWKVVSSLIFAFYVWFFYDEINSGFNNFSAAWYPVTVMFLRELVALVFVNLFFFWPVAMAVVFYKSDELGAERLLKFISILTLVLWFVFVVYFFFSKGIDKFLFDSLKKMIPNV
ncbi:MAG: hypothetical protein MUD12_09385 [Spirochaetes bacterium]|jgi:hypothetical protein|nr:hypothetical protein [Spirochaetota bacterium]